MGHDPDQGPLELWKERVGLLAPPSLIPKFALVLAKWQTLPLKWML